MSLMSLKQLLDINYQLKQTKKYKLKITLKIAKTKGIGLYATQIIKKGENIAYYKLRVCDNTKYQSETDFMYAFTIFTRSGRPIPELIGDIDETSFPPPVRDLPYWGPFVNEPSTNQDINAGFNPNLKDNYKKCGKCGPRKGDLVIYTLYALRDIKVGEEIVVYYGDDYTRDYVLDTVQCEEQLRQYMAH
jgi:hypothetical protein